MLTKTKVGIFDKSPVFVMLKGVETLSLPPIIFLSHRSGYARISFGITDNHDLFCTRCREGGFTDDFTKE